MPSERKMHPTVSRMNRTAGNGKVWSRECIRLVFNVAEFYVVQERQAPHVAVQKSVSHCQLAEGVHVTHLYVKRFGELVAQCGKHPVLVKVIVHHLPTGVDQYFVAEGHHYCLT